MKTTVVPAQITTVEDKIAGSLNLSQLLLLAAPVFGGCALYIIFPPMLRFAPYKVVLMTILVFAFGLLAIRVKGKILLLWLIVITRYNLRPRFYVVNKNDMHLRNTDTDVALEAVEDEPKTKPSPIAQMPQLSTADLVRLERIMANPQVNLTFKPAKKGGLSVVITEVE